MHDSSFDVNVFYMYIQIYIYLMRFYKLLLFDFIYLESGKY